jgi:hypothetical protein
MRGGFFEPLLQRLRNDLADGPVLLAATGSNRLNQGSGQIDSKDRFGRWDRSHLKAALCAKQIAVGLAGGDTLADQSRQNGF